MNKNIKTALMSLFVANRAKGQGFRVEGMDDEEASIYIYDAIGSWFGIDAQEFVRSLNSITANTIHLRINSPGGDVFDARAMITAVRQHKSKIVAHIDGLAASAATGLALAADEVEISEGLRSSDTEL